MEIYVAILVAGLAAVLAGVAFVAHRRLRRRRLLLVAWSFVLFTAKGAYLVGRSFDARGQETWILPVAAFDLAILGMLYLAVRFG